MSLTVVEVKYKTIYPAYDFADDEDKRDTEVAFLEKFINQDAGGEEGWMEDGFLDDKIEECLDDNEIIPDNLVR